MIRSEETDVVIVGAGPAGLCAALYAGRGMLRAVLLERGVPGGELLNTEWIDDYPGFEHILGRELAAKMASHARAFGADIRQENVEGIQRRADGIIAVVGGGDAAVEEADYLTRYAEKVYVIHRREEFRASKILQERLFANPKIEVIWNKRVLELTGGPAGLQSVELV